MKVRIFPGRAEGAVRVPPSKSLAHRMLIAAGLANGVSRIRNVGDCEDVRATLDCLSCLGADCRTEGMTVTVRGGLLRSNREQVLPCRESGSTLRFLIPIALTAPFPVTFTGAGRLPERPQTVYRDICTQQELGFAQSGSLLIVEGSLRPGDFRIPGNISSQFITGLLFALPLLPEDSRIVLIPPVESRSYLNLTLDVLNRFGVSVDWDGKETLVIPGRQHFTPADCTVEGDWSGGAFWEALGRLGDNAVCVPELDPQSAQGDRVCIRYLDALQRGHAVCSLADCPDLGPVLFAYAGAMHGGTFPDASRLRIKESDRIAAMQAELAKCGVSVRVSGDTVTVTPGMPHVPTVPFDGHNDHRIVMALSILATRIGGEIIGADAVRKSYPAFFSDLSALGIPVEVQEDPEPGEETVRPYHTIR